MTKSEKPTKARTKPTKPGPNDTPPTKSIPSDTPPVEAKPTTQQPKRLSALDAAAAVLASTVEPMTAKAIVEAMASRGLWASPGGKTPHATLHAAMQREIALKGGSSRFRKVGRGLFVAN